MSPSKVDLEVLPFDHVEMYGDPDKDSAYTLSGQIAVTLVPPAGWFCDAPPADERFLLHSLVVTFEGQSELVAPQTGHASCRLIEFSQELITDGPIKLSHNWDQGSSREPARWFITFNLKIPGWLPASCTTTFGNRAREEPEVSYRLFAVARYREANPNPSQLSWRNLCYSSSSVPPMQVGRTFSVPVQINRYKLPPPQCLLGDSEFPECPFRTAEYAGSIQEGGSRIPFNILSKLRMRACVPEHIPLDAGSFPLLLKVRPHGLSAEERRRLHLNGFFVSAVQKERMRSSVSQQYAADWPVPPASEQPPNTPLRSRRRDTREYDCGLFLTPPPGTAAHATHSLLPTGFSGRIELDGADAAKASFDDPRFDDDHTWIRMRLDVPFRELLLDSQYLPQYADHPVPKLRPTEMGPILSILHTLEIALTCTYDMPAGAGSASASASTSTDPDKVVDELRLTIPLSFVRVPRSGPNRPVVESFTADCDDPLSRTGPAGTVRVKPRLIAPSEPYAHSLPAYNQLYHKDGVRREDPTPLPLYTPKKGQSAATEEDPVPSMTVCKQTPLHKAKIYSTPALPRL
ncbi:hypothetical protein C8Q80DRAFT_1121058 [Daedaleopsis nitida]|nr:hypothetical protein C8Q80DRAFT_1121058 [Daedaleopsis nitida]